MFARPGTAVYVRPNAKFGNEYSWFAGQKGIVAPEQAVRRAFPDDTRNHSGKTPVMIAGVIIYFSSSVLEVDDLYA